MESTLRISRGLAVARGVVRRRFRAHPFVSFLIVAALLGGGLRFVPASTAATPGSTGQGSTACAAK
jgi:hypothetical protein